MSQFKISHYDPAIEEIQQSLQLAKSTGAAPEVIQKIESAVELVRLRDDFTLKATTEQSQPLKGILEETRRHDWKRLHEEGKTSWRLSPGMISGQLQGQFLKSIVSIQKAKRILEIGMFTGYSALAMAEALPADGEVVSVDVEKYLETLVTELTKSSPHHKKIKIIIGKALDVLKDLVGRGEKFDIIFLDANKSEYLDYFKVAFEGGLLNQGGTILVDNAYLHGEGYQPDRGDTPTKLFAQAIASDPSLHKILVPVRDGVLMIRRLSDVEGSSE